VGVVWRAEGGAEKEGGREGGRGTKAADGGVTTAGRDRERMVGTRGMNEKERRKIRKENENGDAHILEGEPLFWS
jgi:hypothetical protein